MQAFDTRHKPMARDAVAPDGTDVRILLRLAGGSMAHFQLAPGEVSTAVTHRTVEEIWYFLGGRGEMWRKQDGREHIVQVHAGTCVSMPLGTHFQLRADATQGDDLEAVAVTMPPWPGEGDAEVVPGPWRPTVPRP
jgi:mannose-6-phosphate isomerase-like protein (cupin superfamily)